MAASPSNSSKTMNTIDQIKEKLKQGAFEFTRHAFKRTVERNISAQEIKEIADTLEIIEDYPDDKYTPSSLLLGFTYQNRVLHLQISRLASDNLKIITLYEPNPDEWINYKIRRK